MGTVFGAVAILALVYGLVGFQAWGANRRMHPVLDDLAKATIDARNSDAPSERRTVRATQRLPVRRSLALAFVAYTAMLVGSILFGSNGWTRIVGYALAGAGLAVLLLRVRIARWLVGRSA